LAVSIKWEKTGRAGGENGAGPQRRKRGVRGSLMAGMGEGGAGERGEKIKYI